MLLMMLWLQLNDAGWFFFWWNSSTAQFKTGGGCQTLKSPMLTESLSGYVRVGFLIINQLPCPHLITSAWPSPPPWLRCERTSGEPDILHGLRSQLSRSLELWAVFTGGTVGQLSSRSSNSNISTRGESSCQQGFLPAAPSLTLSPGLALWCR